jgi:tetrahydromethanopterin S-methyltransferase subunit G
VTKPTIASLSAKVEELTKRLEEIERRLFNEDMREHVRMLIKKDGK